jgi:ubiquinone/menaquinone biosynthesis C-methylase UbiE
MAAANKSLLDVGAGTGNYRRFIADSVRYIWLDCDSQKLQGYLAKHQSGLAALASATQLCFRDKTVDFALCVAVSHHLNEEELRRLFAELARVIRCRLVFLDAIECKARMISNLLWKYDRGSFPRTSPCLRATMARAFEIELVEEFCAYHRYILCVGRPRL